MEKCEKPTAISPKNVQTDGQEPSSSPQYQGELINIIMKIPSSTAELTITASRIENGEIKRYETHMDTDEIFSARKDFLENVEFADDYDNVYVLTDKGRSMADQATEQET